MEAFPSLSPSARLVAVFLLAGISAKFIKGSSKSKKENERELNLPPGPKLDPFIGHLRLVSPTEPWKSFAEWGQKWGDVVYTSLFGHPMVILNSIEAARDLLDRRGAIYSDRPHSLVWNDALGWDQTLPFLHYGDQWRRQRRVMQQAFNSQSVKAFEGLQVEQVRLFILDLLARPNELSKVLDRFTSSLIVKATYGYQIKREDDPLVSLAVQASGGSVAEGGPGGSIFDNLPVLRFLPSWLPGVSFKQRWERVARLVRDTIQVPFAIVCERRSSADSSKEHSFLDDLLDKYDSKSDTLTEQEREVHIDDLKNVAGVMYAAGVETTNATLTTFFLLMARHPEVVAKAQEEIDRVIGNGRFPNLDDRKSIPYVDCILKEVLRSHAALPLSIIHLSTEDDIFRGMAIPKGTAIIPNVWRMMNDERYFPEPDIFKPERFAKKVADMKDPLQCLNGLALDDPSSIVFGFGRRICPGRHFADAALWLAIANIFAIFDIRSPTDSSGKLILPEVDFEYGMVVHPRPFKSIISPRNERCLRLLREGML